MNNSTIEEMKDAAHRVRKKFGNRYTAVHLEYIVAEDGDERAQYQVYCDAISWGKPDKTIEEAVNNFLASGSSELETQLADAKAAVVKMEAAIAKYNEAKP